MAADQRRLEGGQGVGEKREWKEDAVVAEDDGRGLCASRRRQAGVAGGEGIVGGGAGELGGGSELRERRGAWAAGRASSAAGKAVGGARRGWRLGFTQSGALFFLPAA